MANAPRRPWPTRDPAATGPPGSLRLGLRANLAQFSLLVGVNALVGGMVGQERSLLSLLAAGTLCDRYGRKPVLVVGWLVGLPVPALRWGSTQPGRGKWQV